MTDTLHTKYRPQEFSEVVGNKATVDSVQAQLAKGSQRAFLFHGPTGTGKTTFARLIAKTVNAQEHNVVEFNAGIDTGVDAIRTLIDQAQYRGMGTDAKVFIMDEVQMLSKQAWNAMLKLLEEPPEWLYWCLCTTEPKKVPKTILSRCSVYQTQRLRNPTVLAKLKKVTKAEGIELPMSTLELVAEHSSGSLRTALTTLASCASVDSTEDINELLAILPEDDPTAIDLCRALGRAKGFTELQPVLKALPDSTNPESARRIVRSYFSKVALGAKTADQFLRAGAILEAFSEPCVETTGVAPLVCACVKFVRNHLQK